MSNIHLGYQSSQRKDARDARATVWIGFAVLGVIHCLAGILLGLFCIAIDYALLPEAGRTSPSGGDVAFIAMITGTPLLLGLGYFAVGLSLLRGGRGVILFGLCLIALVTSLVFIGFVWLGNLTLREHGELGFLFTGMAGADFLAHSVLLLFMVKLQRESSMMART